MSAARPFFATPSVDLHCECLCSRAHLVLSSGSHSDLRWRLSTLSSHRCEINFGQRIPKRGDADDIAQICYFGSFRPAARQDGPLLPRESRAGLATVYVRLCFSGSLTESRADRLNARNSVKALLRGNRVAPRCRSLNPCAGR